MARNKRIDKMNATKAQVLDKRSTKGIIRLDFLMALSTGIIGVVFCLRLESILGLSTEFIVIVSAFHLIYSCYSGYLYFKKEIIESKVRLLIYANMFWTIVSIVLLIIYWNSALILGKALLVLQVLVLGGLAYFEEKQLKVSLQIQD